MNRYKVTLHALKPGGQDEVSYREAESITLASAPVWAGIPRADHYHYTVSIEYAPLPAPPAVQDAPHSLQNPPESTISLETP